MNTIASFCLALTLLSTSAMADTMRLPIGEQNDRIQGTKPQRGLSSHQVHQQFGEPGSRHGPVGQPAIIYWEYDQFTVYFEGDYVIHSVAKIKSNEVY